MPKGKAKVKGAGGNKGGKRVNEKQKQRIVEDKTFGLKNKKKSKKVQKYVQTVQKQVDHQHNMGKKKDTKKSKNEIDEFIAYKPVVQQKKIEKGVDPKSILCEYFKQGKCSRGKNCRYSHDLAIERKAAKIDLYTDTRDDDNMDDWDQDKLEDVVRKKHSAHNSNKTDIVCKYFLDAVENKKYGWFWDCPNGVTCKYRHALPPGYILKKDRVKEVVSTVDIVVEIEEQRKTLETHTPITEERFLAWKKKKADERAAAQKKLNKKRQADIKSGAVAMSGREMFAANPNLFIDDDMAADSSDVQVKEEFNDPNVPINIITATGTSITRTSVNPTSKTEEKDKKDNENVEKEEITATEVVDESLFGGEDLEDLDDIDDSE